MIPKEIILKDYKFQNEYYVSGHYDFIIEVEYEDGDKMTIERRYSEIRALYKTLLFNCPGCIIPNIPSKSIWLKINVGNKDQMEERKEGIREFLSHLAQHKILRKNKYVVNFFSPNYKRITNDNKSSKNQKNAQNDNDSDDEFNYPSFDFDKDDKKKEEKNKNDDIEDDEDILPLNEFIEEYNDKNKGIVSKGKQIFGNMYSYIKSFTTSSNNEEEEKENNNKDNNYYKKLTKEDYEFIDKKRKELGEDFEVNEYENKISRLNEGLKSSIDNFEKLIAINDKQLTALDNIINNDNKIKNLSKGNFNKKDEFEEEGDTNAQSLINNHKNNISKLRLYSANQKNYWKKTVVENLNKIKKYQILLQSLLDIYERKKEHINFLGRLHSKKEEIKKENENKNEPLIKTKIDDLEKKLNHEIKFINKINKDLKYEIDIYKENQEDIYIYINCLYKEKSSNIKNSIENLNKEYTEEIKDEENDKSNISNEKSDDKKEKEYIDENKYDDF